MAYNVMGLMSISTEMSHEVLLCGVRKERNECNLVSRVSLQRKEREKLGERLKRMLNCQPTTNLIPFVFF